MMAVILAIIISLAASGSALYSAGRSWHDPLYDAAGMPMIRLLPMRNSGKRRIGAAIVPIVAMCISVLGLFLLAGFHQSWHILGESLFRGLDVGVTCCFCLSLAVAAGIVLLGRPRWLIPPSLRMVGPIGGDRRRDSRG
jgi:hypothetical protein